MPARRSWSQTEVRSASNSRFAPLQSISSPADRVVDETSRENAWSSSLSSACRSTSLVACARLEGQRKRMPHRGRLAHPIGGRQLFAADDEHPHWILHLRERDEHRWQRAEIFGRAAEDARDVGDKLRFFVPEQAAGNHPGRPGMRRQVIDTERRGRLQGVAACGRTEKEWSFGPRRRTRHGGGAPAAGR